MKKLLVLIVICAFAKAYSQDLSGVVTYQSQRSVDLKMNEGMDSAMQKQIQEQLKKQFQKTYTLKFDGAESIYTEDEGGIAPPQPAASGISIVVSSSSDIRYNNLEEESYKNQTDLMGKTFLVSDSLDKKDWKLVKEVKNIGKYTCFKAIFEEEVKEWSMTEDGEETKEKKMKTTTVWYTLDIPVQHGPDNYWGLPGLVMEVNDGKFSLMCTKVALNPSEGVAIEKPIKGKAVSGEEFSKISEEKTKEMMERYSGGRKKGENSSFTIKIGG